MSKQEHFFGLSSNGNLGTSDAIRFRRMSVLISIPPLKVVQIRESFQQFTGALAHVNHDTLPLGLHTGSDESLSPAHF